MRKTGQRQNIPGKLTINLRKGDLSEIQIECASSGIAFCIVKISSDELIAALGRQGFCECELEVLGLDLVGKTHEGKHWEYELGALEGSSWRNKELAREKALELCPEGWTPDLHFDSQNSFFSKDGKEYARTYIRRYV